MMNSFIDTNLVVYANDAADPRKQELAIDLIQSHMRSGTGVISTQVMQEYAVNAFQKLGQSIPVVMHQLHLLESLQVVTVTPALVRRAVEIKSLYALNYWDSLIISAAESAGCVSILSEDLNSGQSYCGVRCVNPFEGSPGGSAR
jgi:predicted nucleic acid-binding protein